MDNIATINGKAAIAYLDATPWHGLGERMTPEQAADLDLAMAAAGLNWQVDLQPVQLLDGTVIPSAKATVRIDAAGVTPLAVVGNDYSLIQNGQAAEIMRPLIEDLGCRIAVGGALGDGQRCWLLAQLPNATITPVPGDDVRGYGLLDWSHDGQTQLRLLGTGVRVVCQNTLNLAVGKAKGKAWIKVRHTSSAAQRLDEAAAIVRQLSEAMQHTGDTFAALARRRMNPAELKAYIAASIPDAQAVAGKVSKVIEARRQTIEALAYQGKGAAMANQLVDGVSLWGAWNAITEYWDHVRTAEASSPAGLLKAQTSAVFGGNADLKAAALVVAQRLLGAAA